MSLNLSDRIAVIQSQTMQTRVTGAVAKYALYLLGNGASTTEQKAWAKGAMDALPGMANKVSPHLLDDTNFLESGSGVTDQQLQGAVETVVNSRFIVSA